MPKSRTAVRPLLALCLSLTVLSFGAAQAADGQGRYSAKGAGRFKCDRFLTAAKEQKQQELNAVVDWVNGYITAVNMTQPTTYDIAPWQSDLVMFDLISRICTQKPDEPIVNAVVQMLQSFAANKLATVEQPIDAKSGSNSVKVYPTALKQAQTTLVKLGLLSGTADGTYGPKTKTAIEAFQDKYKVKKTGVPDMETLFALFIVANSSP